jgi:cation diffusion facilitator family transporter
MKPFALWSKKQIGYLEGIVSVGVNTLLFAFKLWVGTAFQSVAMTADAWHTLSDSFTSFVVILGFWISSRPADREHPYGHGRAELVASVIIGTLLVVVGLTFLYESIERLVHFKQSLFGPAAVAVFAVSILFKEGLAQFSSRLGKRIGSSVLVADAWHHRSDAIASALIVTGALAGPYLWWVDGVLGILVSGLILFAAFTIFRENTNLIMGEALPARRMAEIKDLVAGAAPEISDIHHFHAHRYGDHTELTFHIRVRKNMDVACAHELCSRIEQLVKKKYGFEATIHIEPELRERGRGPS